MGMFDYAEFCVMCGKVVFKHEWRKHLIEHHKLVATENPRDKDGKWKESDKIKYATMEVQT